ncbi:MAG: YtxH domain-containing protein [Candidatus Kapabacteria bacterium]|nr:YtxH domain-containing protein [Ignavibacteriota bacterium]MCW5884527.1 YtxH domain-containing protein [Candidatus Kapabacteria bacterium]
MTNSNEQGNFARGFIIGAVAGGLAGAIAALLMAPKTGAELRKDIADTSVDLYDKAQDYFKHVEEDVANMVSEGRNKASTIYDSAKTKAEGLLHDAENVLKDARFKASQTKEQIQNRIDHIRDAAKAGGDAFKEELNS